MDFDMEIILGFLLAILWGGLVGAEREYRGKAAGFRTTIMISFGACFFTLMSMAIGGHDNPDRIAANIVTGIGFLGAGVIFRGENSVNGITTAATIWAVAAVGMGLGAGYYLAAGCASILILFILAVLPYVQYRIDKINQIKMIRVKALVDSDAKSRIEEALKEFKLHFVLMRQIREGKHINLFWQVRGSASKLEKFVADTINKSFIDRFEC